MKIKLLEIKKSEVYTKEENTYDLEVAEDNSYNVNGILVHNSACLTRKQTGCGVPMVSLILECADVAHSVDGHICADGGIVDVGDISKAFCLNSDFVMIGGMFAGTDEAEGEIIEKKVLTDFLDENGERQVKINKYKEFYGM